MKVFTGSKGRGMDLDNRVNELESKLHDLQMNTTMGIGELSAQTQMIQKELQILVNQQTKIFDAVYGNGREGLVTTFAKVAQKQALVWGLIAAVGLTAMSLGAFVLAELLSNFF